MNASSIWTEELEVRTHDTDLFGRCKPAAYYRLMEEVTVHHSMQLKVDYFRLQAYDLAWVLARSKTRFFAFPSADTTLIVKTWPKGWSQKIFGMRDYSITTRAGQLCALGTSAWLLIDTSKRQFVKPDRLPLSLPDNQGLSALEDPLEKLIHPTDMLPAGEFQASYSSLDLLGHVNNTRYVDWIFDSLPISLLEKQTPSWLQINFSTELKPGETVLVEKGTSPSTPEMYAIRGFNRSTESLVFEAHCGLRVAGSG